MLMLRKEHGVTLLELLIVIIIIGILGAIAVPRFLRTAEDARVADATRSLGEIRSAILTARGSDPTYDPTTDIDGVGGTDTIAHNISLDIITFNNPSAYWGYAYDIGAGIGSANESIRASKNAGVAGPMGRFGIRIASGLYYDAGYVAVGGGTLPEPHEL